MGIDCPPGDIRVAQQVVVEVLAVAAEESRELVDLALGEIQLGEVVRIAAEAAADSPEGIDKGALFAWECMHLKGLAKHAQSGLHIDQRVVHGSAAREAVYVPTHIHTLMDRVPFRSRNLCFGHRKWSGGRRILSDGDARHHHHCNGDSNAPRDMPGHCGRGLLLGQPGKTANIHHFKPHWKKRRSHRDLAPVRS